MAGFSQGGGDRDLFFGSGFAEQYHLRWFESHLPAFGVHRRSLRTEMPGFALAGPRSRELLARVCPDDVSDATFPFLSFRAAEVAVVPARIGRISFTGELGYESWVPAEGAARRGSAMRCARRAPAGIARPARAIRPGRGADAAVLTAPVSPTLPLESGPVRVRHCFATPP